MARLSQALFGRRREPTGALCGFRDTVSGEPCRNPVAPWSHQCRARHPVRPRPAAAGEATAPAPPGTLSFEDVAGESEETEQVGVAPKPWKMRTLTTAGLSAAAVFTSIQASTGGVAHPWEYAVGTGFALTAAKSWFGHRDDAKRAEAVGQRLEQLTGVEQRRRRAQEAIRNMAGMLDNISTADGGDRDELRGEFTGFVVQSLGGCLPDRSAVALYKMAGGSLEPTGMQVGWHTRPFSIPLDSPLGDVISHLVVERSVEHRATRGGRDQIVAPVRAGSTMFGALVVDAPDGVFFDQADVDYVWTCANLLGAAYRGVVAPVEREWAAPLQWMDPSEIGKSSSGRH